MSNDRIDTLWSFAETTKDISRYLEWDRANQAKRYVTKAHGAGARPIRLSSLQCRMLWASHFILRRTNLQIQPIHDDPNSGCPYPLDCFCQTHIVRLEFVQSNSHSQSSCPKTPPKQGSSLWQSLCWNVVDDDGLEPDMGVDYNRGTQNGVCDWIKSSSGERGDGKRYQCNRHQPIESRSATGL